MTRVLLLATTTGYQTRAFGEAADRLGVQLVFATDRCHVLEDPWQDAAIPIRFHDEHASVDAIVEAARSTSLDGILAVGDRPTLIAAMVAERLGLPGHPPAAAAIARDKQRTRGALERAGLPCPWFVPATVDRDPRELAGELSFPCVVKPVALSASRGVIRADDEASFCTAYTRLRALLRSPDVRIERNAAHERILVEGFIPGREYAVEGLFERGALTVLALFDKPDPLDGPFFEETIYLTPPSIPDRLRYEIEDAITRAACAIGLWHGPIHAECRVNPSGVFVLEIAARPIGGLCARALRFVRKDDEADAISLEELLLRHALGELPDRWTRVPCASGVMIIPVPGRGTYRGVSGLDRSRCVHGVDDVIVTAKLDQLLVPLPEGASYLGFIFARGATPAGVDRSLRAAHEQLHFFVEPEIRVV